MKIKQKIIVIVSSKVKAEDIDFCLKLLIEKYPNSKLTIFEKFSNNYIAVDNRNNIFKNISFSLDYNKENINIVKLFYLALRLGMEKFEKAILIINPLYRRLFTKDKILASFISLNNIEVYNPSTMEITSHSRMIFLVKTTLDILKVYVNLVRDIFHKFSKFPVKYLISVLNNFVKIIYIFLNSFIK